MDMLAYNTVEFNYMETLAKTFIIRAKQNQFFQENGFNNALVRRVVIAMNANSAFTGAYTEKPFWYQHFDLRETGTLRSGQLFIQSDAASNCRLHVATMKAMIFQDDIPSIPIDSFTDHSVLVFDLTSMQDASENCDNPKLVGQPLRLELNLTFPLEFASKLIELGERMSSVAVDKFDVVGRNCKRDNASLQGKINRTPILKCRHPFPFPNDYVATLDSDTFAIKNTQPSRILGEHSIKIANFCPIYYFAECLGRKNYSFLKQQNA